MKIYFHRRKVNLKEIDIYKIREIFCGRKMRKNLWKVYVETFVRQRFSIEIKGKGRREIVDDTQL